MSVYSGCLKNIMSNILNTAKTTVETYGLGKDYLAGANIAAFENVANAVVCLRFFAQSSITTIGDFYVGFKKAYYFK